MAACCLSMGCWRPTQCTVILRACHRWRPWVRLAQQLREGHASGGDHGGAVSGGITMGIVALHMCLGSGASPVLAGCPCLVSCCHGCCCFGSAGHRWQCQRHLLHAGIGCSWGHHAAQNTTQHINCWCQIPVGEPLDDPCANTDHTPRGFSEATEGNGHNSNMGSGCVNGRSECNSYCCISSCRQPGVVPGRGPLPPWHPLTRLPPPAQSPPPPVCRRCWCAAARPPAGLPAGPFPPPSEPPPAPHG